MNFDKSTIEFILVVAGFVGGFVYVIAQAYNGRGQKKLDDLTEADKTIKLIRDRADALELRVKDLERSLIEEQKKIVALETEKTYIEKLNKQYLDILQNRDPELLKFMETTSRTLEIVAKGIEALLSKPTVSINNQPVK